MALREDDLLHVILLEQFVDVHSAKAMVLALHDSMIAEVVGFMFWVRHNGVSIDAKLRML